MKPAAYDPDTGIGSLAGKVILVTGATAGLGRASLDQIAKHGPAKIIFTGRKSETGKEVIEEIQKEHSGTPLVFVQCDLGSLQSCRQAAEKIIEAASGRLDLVIASAGIMATEPGLTKDGFEVQFGTNHLGHAALIHQLLPTLNSTAEQSGSDVRIVIVSSEGHKLSSAIPYDRLETDLAGLMGSWTRYGHSKLANVLYAKALANRYPSIVCVAIHPGVIITGLTTGLSFSKRWFVYLTTLGTTLTLQDGIKNHLWASFCKREDVTTGKYYRPVGEPDGESQAGQKSEEADRLYEWTQDILKKHGFQ